MSTRSNSSLCVSLRSAACSPLECFRMVVPRYCPDYLTTGTVDILCRSACCCRSPTTGELYRSHREAREGFLGEIPLSGGAGGWPLALSGASNCPSAEGWRGSVRERKGPSRNVITDGYQTSITGTPIRS